MPLAAGTRLGPYEILAPIGKGGMGEVYKARDTRLDRTVAIKVLPDYLAGSPERKARFEREAKAISQLNHPNICTLYDVGEQDGTDFIVMEYIEGETLAERLKGGALPLDMALECGSQIADGLDKAHRAGIVHRDLKPGNIMLTKSGMKILDFGLARLLADESVSVESDASTRQHDLTSEEALVGTLQYMAPEQVEGRTADARTDIFAFGVVLYEMVTGRKAFAGSSQASLIGAILKDEPPPIRTVRPAAAPELDRVLRKCLAKDPENRWASAHDVAEVLFWRSSHSPESTGRSHLPSRLALLVVLVAAFGAVLAMSIDRGERLDRMGLVRFSIDASTSGAGPLRPMGPSLDISPDGRTIALATLGSGEERPLLLRDIANLEMRSLRDTEGGRRPFFSPDGEWLGYSDDEKLMKVPTRGGVPQVICPVEQSVRGASWGDDGFIYFNVQTLGIFRVSAAGGEPTLLLAPRVDEDIKSVRFPHVLPGGRALLFSVGHASMESYDQATIALLSLDTGEVKPLIKGGSNPRYAPTGHIVYGRNGQLMAAPFDLESLDVNGEPRVVIPTAATSHVWGNAEFAVSKSGALVYLSGSPKDFSMKTSWIDREGRAEPFEVDRDIFEVEISPSGEEVALWESKGNDDLWTLDRRRGTLTRITDRWDNVYPTWMPDGESLLYLAMPPGDGIVRRASDGTGATEVLLQTQLTLALGNVSPDSQYLAYSDGDSIWVLPLSTDRKPELFLDAARAQTAPRFSPDGEWMAYVSNETGREEIYVVPFLREGNRILISTNGGQQPLWSGDGRELFFYGGSAVHSVAIRTEPEFHADAPAALFVWPGLHDYDVTPEGDRFLVVERDVTSLPDEIHVVLSWSEELKHVFSTGR